VQPSAQMVEVSIEEIKQPAGTSSDAVVSLQGGLSVLRSPTKRSFKKIASSPSAPRNDTNRAMSKGVRLKPFDTGVRVKANPDYFQNPAPGYPELARQMRQEGIVMLSVDVDKEGDPVSVEIIQSSGFRMLDQAALKAVRHWKFQPGSLGGVPVDSTVTVPIRFKLEK